MANSNNNMHRYPLNGRYATLGDLVLIFGKYSEDYPGTYVDEGWKRQPFKAIVFGNNYNSNGDLIAQNPYELVWFDNVYSETEKQLDGKTMKIILDKDSNLYGFDRPIRAKDVKDSSLTKGAYAFRFIIPNKANETGGLTRYYYNYKNSYGESTVMYAILNIIKTFKEVDVTENTIQTFFFGNSDVSIELTPLRIFKIDTLYSVYTVDNNDQNDKIINPTISTDVKQFDYDLVHSTTVSLANVSNNINGYLKDWWNLNKTTLTYIKSEEKQLNVSFGSNNSNIFGSDDKLVDIHYSATHIYKGTNDLNDTTISLDSSSISGTAFLKIKFSDSLNTIYTKDDNDLATVVDSVRKQITQDNNNKGTLIPSIFCIYDTDTIDNLYEMISGSSAYSNLGSVTWSYLYILYPNYTDDFTNWLSTINSSTQWNEDGLIKRAPRQSGTDGTIVSLDDLYKLINECLSSNYTLQNDPDYAYRNKNATKYKNNSFYKILYFSKIFLNSLRFFTSYVTAFTYVKVSNKTYASNEPILLCDVNMFEVIESFEIISAVHNPTTALPAYPITKNTTIQIDTKYKIKFENINGTNVPESWTFTLTFNDIINASKNSSTDYILYSLIQVGNGTEIKYGSRGFPSLKGTLDGITDASLGTNAWPSTDLLDLGNVTQELIDNLTDYENTDNINTYNGITEVINNNPCGMLRIHGIYDKSSDENKKKSAFTIDVSLYRHKNYYGIIDTLSNTGGQEVNIYYQNEVLYTDDVPNVSITYITSEESYTKSKIDSEFGNISNIYTVQTLGASQYFNITLKTETGKYKYYKSKAKELVDSTTEKSGYTNNLDLTFLMYNTGIDSWVDNKQIRVTTQDKNSTLETLYKVLLSNSDQGKLYIRFKFKNSNIYYYIKLSSITGNTTVNMCPLLSIDGDEYESLLRGTNKSNSSADKYSYGYLLYNDNIFEDSRYLLSTCNTYYNSKTEKSTTTQITSTNNLQFKITSLCYKNGVTENGRYYYSNKSNITLNMHVMYTKSSDEYEYTSSNIFILNINLNSIGGLRYVYFSLNPIYVINVNSNINTTGFTNKDSNDNVTIKNLKITSVQVANKNTIPINNNFKVFSSNNEVYLQKDYITINYNGSDITLETLMEKLSHSNYTINITGIANSFSITKLDINNLNERFKNYSLSSNVYNNITMSITGLVNNKYTLNINILPNDGGYISGGNQQLYNYNESVTITANANNNYQFYEWESETGDLLIQTKNNSTLTFTYTGDSTSVYITANFKIKLSININDSNYDGVIKLTTNNSTTEIQFNNLQYNDYYIYSLQITIEYVDSTNGLYYGEKLSDNNNDLSNPYTFNITSYKNITFTCKKYVTISVLCSIDNGTALDSNNILTVSFNNETVSNNSKKYKLNISVTNITANIKDGSKYEFDSWDIPSGKLTDVTENRNTITSAKTTTETDVILIVKLKTIQLEGA